MSFEFYLFLLIYGSGFIGGISYGFVYGVTKAKPSGSGLPNLTGYADFPLPAPNESRPTTIQFTPGQPIEKEYLIALLCRLKNAPVYLEKRSFPEGDLSTKFDKETYPEQYNG